ncbi:MULTISPECIES: hypothetical protein [unclassified Bradyrhizobium]|uniref:hypothetical protein n=1 Tax=unclassified Bradyrhizobium TaxID=2631580 RepID=UPI0020B45B10|nr:MULTISPECIES: hypothetical protein [unclassified Bradyrhizobium]MCP3402792.1 hypothetical protein [Bradyrhizobium sp. CCGB20]MCP3411270.1 hypothetical protein [Bradyrhizobium sp. CCGB01]
MTFPALPFEPFGELLTSAGCLTQMFRIGYRISGTDTVLTFTEVPFSVVRQWIPQEISVSVSLRQNGGLIASLELGETAERNVLKEVSLVQLVQELIEPHRLSMEEVKTSDLDVLLLALESSAQFVRTAISTLKSNKDPPCG